LQVRRHIIIGFQIVGGIPPGKGFLRASLGGHTSLLPVLRNFDRAFDVSTLGSLIASPEQHGEKVTALQKIVAIPRNEISTTTLLLCLMNCGN
jgi:hypothetical protein